MAIARRKAKKKVTKKKVTKKRVVRRRASDLGSSREREIRKQRMLVIQLVKSLNQINKEIHGATKTLRSLETLPSAQSFFRDRMSTPSMAIDAMEDMGVSVARINKDAILWLPSE